MRVALAVVACLALIAACQGTKPTTRPSPSLPITDLSSVRLPTPPPTAGAATHTPPPTTGVAASPTPIELTPTPTPSAPPTPTATTPASATPFPTSGPPTPTASSVAVTTPAADCVNGWTSPAAGSAEYDAAFEMIEGQMGVSGPWTVDEMRYFTGPDVPWIIEPHYDVVQYWYVKASRADDSSFAGRWLLEQRTDLIRGISAVAPYVTTGYASPDWVGFVGDGVPQIYTDLPGEWPGIPYDFVTGEGDSGQPGLPDEVVGCLAGT